MSRITENPGYRTWTFDSEAGLPQYSQKAKSQVAEEHDVKYQDLVATTARRGSKRVIIVLDMNSKGELTG